MSTETERSSGNMAAKKSAPMKGPPPPAEMLGLPKRLERAMRRRDLNQVELAKLSGVSQPVISTTLTGDNLPGVTACVIARLSLALRVPPGFLLIGEGDVIPSLKADVDGVVRIDENRHPLVPELPVQAVTRRRRSRRS